MCPKTTGPLQVTHVNVFSISKHDVFKTEANCSDLQAGRRVRVVVRSRRRVLGPGLSERQVQSLGCGLAAPPTQVEPASTDYDTAGYWQ